MARIQSRQSEWSWLAEPNPLFGDWHLSGLWFWNMPDSEDGELPEGEDDAIYDQPDEWRDQSDE